MIASTYSMASDENVGNKIQHHQSIGYILDVYDFRPETLKFMDENNLQGGGPTWLALIQAALELESPTTLETVNFDDESDVVRITSGSESSIKVIQMYVSLIMTDSDFRDRCIKKAKVGGYLE